VANKTHRAYKSYRPFKPYIIMENDNKLTVFDNENSADNIDFGVEQGRPRALLIAGAGAALLLGILIVALVMSKPAADSEFQNIVRAGSPEFDAYKDKVVLKIDRDSRVVYDNWLGMWRLKADVSLSNFGDRDLLSVEVIGKLIDHEDKVLTQSVKMPIPRSKPGPLKPGESKTIELIVDAPPKITEAEVKDITIELRGLRFR
jgi:hypothetical protein